MEIKLTTKEEKVMKSLDNFLQKYKECKKEDRKQYLYNNAFLVRNILSFKNLEPKDAHLHMVSMIIHNIIPFIMANENEDIDIVTDLIDNKTNEMLRNLINGE